MEKKVEIISPAFPSEEDARKYMELTCTDSKITCGITQITESDEKKFFVFKIE